MVIFILLFGSVFLGYYLIRNILISFMSKTGAFGLRKLISIVLLLGFVLAIIFTPWIELVNGVAFEPTGPCTHWYQLDNFLYFCKTRSLWGNIKYGTHVEPYRLKYKNADKNETLEEHIVKELLDGTYSEPSSRYNRYREDIKKNVDSTPLFIF